MTDVEARLTKMERGLGSLLSLIRELEGENELGRKTVETLTDNLLAERAARESARSAWLAAVAREHDLQAENQRLREVFRLVADLLRRLAEWDMLNTSDGGFVVADGPYWKAEIEKARAALSSLERPEN